MFKTLVVLVLASSFTAHADPIFESKKAMLCEQASTFYDSFMENLPPNPVTSLYKTVDADVAKFNSNSCSKISDEASLKIYLINSRDNCRSSCSTNAGTYKKDAATLAVECRSLCAYDYAKHFYAGNAFSSGAVAQTKLCNQTAKSDKTNQSSSAAH